MSTLKRHLGILVAAVGLVFVWAQTVSAASIGIMPKQTAEAPSRSWVVHTINPGESLTDTVVISNSATSSLTVVVEALDAINTNDGGFTLVDDPTQNQDLGKWISLSSSTVTIPANSSAEVGFTINVPKDASIGEHSAGIAVYEKPAGTGGGMQFKVRVGARVYITVPGKVIRKLTFTKVGYEFKNGKLVFNITAKNNSNVNLSPMTEIQLRGLLHTAKMTDANSGTFLPGSTVSISKTWNKSTPKVGFFRAKIILHSLTTDEILPDGTKKTLPDEQFVYNLNFGIGLGWLMWLLAILLVGWTVYRWLVWYFDRRKYRIKFEVRTIGRGESVMHIAEKVNVFPQTIIKFNDLKWPFILNVGDKLMIPIGQLSSTELNDKMENQPLAPFWKYWLSYQPSLYRPSSHQRADKSTRLSTKLAKTKVKPKWGK